MKTWHITTFLKSATARLAGTYLLIIMVMTIGFSVVVYNTSSQQLGRQIPPESFFRTNTRDLSSRSIQPGVALGGQSVVTNSDGTTETYAINRQDPDLTNFLKNRVQEGRETLLIRLIILNIGALLLGGAISYALARRSLQPIEESMEAQAQFVSDASHELRTPLTAIQTSNEVFLRRPKATLADAKQLIEQNTEDVIRLKHLSDGLLKLSQQDTHGGLQFAPVHLQDVVGEALNQIVQQATAKSITVQDETPDISVTGDVTTLVQALVILLDNAIKYSHADSTITIAAKAKNKYAYLSVQDQGIGILASDIPHLFRRFYRADNARTSGGERSGYGLGLAIAKQIVENHHGAIEVVSTPAKGSTFTFKLPLA